MKAEMSAEIAKLDATIKGAEAQRSIDYGNLTNSLNDVGKNLPTKATIRNWVLTGFGGVIAAAALAWAIFDTGASVSGSFADQIVDAKEASKNAERSNAQLNAKLDKLIKANENDKSQAGARSEQNGALPPPAKIRP